MKVIWAPWRMTYLQPSRKPRGCIFCIKARERRDAANLLLHRGRHGFIMMNLFPYNTGHLLIAPYAHGGGFEQLAEEAHLDLVRLATWGLRVLKAELHPEGFNLGVNLGRVSGAGIEDHLHWHIVPRWNGDTNFMPVFGDTRVIPEDLNETYKKLRRRFLATAIPTRAAGRSTRGASRTSTTRRP